VIHYTSENAHKIRITPRPFARLARHAGNEMRLASVTPTKKMVYEYQCGNDYVLEFTMGDG
jgi:hypothetical protein